MENKLQLFEFNSQPVRVVWSESKRDWLYTLVDACKILQIGNPSDVVKRLLFPEGVDSIEVLTKGGLQKATCVTLANYADLISRSDTAPALEFRKWVWGEMFPAVLKTGSYSINGDINFDGYDNIKHLDLENNPELLRQAIQLYEDLGLIIRDKRKMLIEIEKENFPGNTFTRGRRKTLDIGLYLRQVADRFQFGVKIVGEEIVTQRAFWGQDRAI